MIVEDIHLIGEEANAAPSQEITTGYRSRCSDCVDLMNCLAFWYVRASSLFMPLSYLIWLPCQAGPVGMVYHVSSLMGHFNISMSG